MKNCCRRSAIRWYRDWLTKSGAADSPSFAKLLLQLIDQQVPIVRPLINAVCFRVANVRSVHTAIAEENVCDRCGDSANIVVLSASYLMVIWRIQLVLVSLINVAEEKAGQLKIRW